MRYAVIIEHDADTGNYDAYAPDLSGCGAVADTHNEVLQLIQEAIEFHLEGLREDGLPIPEPGIRVEYVDAAL